jgi:hypothetical protein
VRERGTDSVRDGEREKEIEAEEEVEDQKGGHREVSAG